MTTPRVYLDNCCYNRPYDDQTILLNRLETEAKMQIQAMAKKGEISLIWSFMLDYENAQNPYREKKEQIEPWKNIACLDVGDSASIAENAALYMKSGLRHKDAVHVACAIKANADFLVTTDKKILNKPITELILINPIDFIRRLYDAE